MMLSKEDLPRKIEALLRPVLEEANGLDLAVVVDAESVPLRLGAALILLAECGLVRRIIGARRCEMAIAHPRGGGSDGERIYLSAIAALARATGVVDECQVGTGCGFPRKHGPAAGTGRYLQWPLASVPSRFKFDSMVVLQTLSGISGSFPVLDIPMPPDFAESRGREDMEGDLPLIAVHLKNVPGALPEESNAALPAWQRFIRLARSRAAFMLVGDDPVPADIAELPNVMLARELFGADLVAHLAAIQRADAFMGMASGPCQAAIFGRKPYVIFKNPGHHPEQMKEELWSARGFSFALPGQSLRQESETPQLLDQCLGEILGSIPAAGSPSVRRVQA